eukprot:TRINITY_DN2455_c0_g1_i3.p1 TRINITY_DN2455_c0_g1~~TRINITY_DN2455_c0_g1_i3.p1  ORF type:complete len:287 (-),score=62.73 TRINITY_DN2455_c0_g1_i3:114-974(-)
MKFGLYYSLLEWNHDINDQKRVLRPEVVAADVRDIVIRYRPSVLWFDGDWGRPTSFWQLLPLLAWLYNESPVRDEIVVNDRLGQGCSGAHGDFFNGRDRFLAESALAHKWECCMTIGSSWGHNRNLSKACYKQPLEVIELLAEVTARNGNLLLNVGPSCDGCIIEEERAVLTGVGEWLAHMWYPAIFDTRPWSLAPVRTRDLVLYTTPKGERAGVVVYGIALEKGAGTEDQPVVVLAQVPPPTAVRAGPCAVHFAVSGDTVSVHFTQPVDFPLVLELTYGVPQKPR